MSRVANGQKKITEMQKHLTAKHYKDLGIILEALRWYNLPLGPSVLGFLCHQLTLPINMSVKFVLGFSSSTQENVLS